MSHLTKVRPGPCEACPYRRDVASGLWAPNEYAKLAAYDEPTFAQPPQPFACHATTDQACHGWAVCHTNRGHDRDLLALRLRPLEVPKAVVPLFSSGTEAAEHGLKDIDSPAPDAVKTMIRLLKKHPRLRTKDQA